MTISTTQQWNASPGLLYGMWPLTHIPRQLIIFALLHRLIVVAVLVEVVRAANFFFCGYHLMGRFI